MSWQFKLPFTVRALTVELRDSSVSTKTAKGKKHKIATGSKLAQLLLNSGLRLLLGVLPNIPVRVKQLTVKHQVHIAETDVCMCHIPCSLCTLLRCEKATLRLQATGFLLDIPRVEVLINSSRLSSKLKVDVKLLPIKAVLETTTGMHDAQLLHWCSMTILMCCAML